MSKYYDEALIPAELRRTFDVYDRIRALQLSLGSFETDVVSLANAGIAGAVLHESGLVYLSGTTGGTLPMADDEERIKHGQDGAQKIADTLIKRLHWALSCGGEGGPQGRLCAERPGRWWLRRDTRPECPGWL